MTILEEICEQLKEVKLPNKGHDLSDIGNEIGICLGKYVTEEMGFEIEDLIAGIKHGISLAKGTH